MNLYVTNGTKLIGKKKTSYEFMKDSYICYLMEEIRVTDRILDEYIYWMNRRFNMYDDRINSDQIEKELTTRSAFHLENFKYIVYGTNKSDDYVKLKNDVDAENMEKVIDFYETMLSITDDAISDSYFYGRGLTVDEHKCIRDKLDKLYPGGDMICYHDVFRFWIFPRLIDNRNEFIEKVTEHFGKCLTIEYTANDDIILELAYKYGSICFGDIWDIVNYCNDKLIYFNIAYDLTTTKKLVFDPIIND